MFPGCYSYDIYYLHIINISYFQVSHLFGIYWTKGPVFASSSYTCGTTTHGSWVVRQPSPIEVYGIEIKSGWWYTYPSEKWWTSSVGICFFPIYGKIKFMFQTTNQTWSPNGWLMGLSVIWSKCTETSPQIQQSGRNQMARQLISNSGIIPILRTCKWASKTSLFWVMLGMCVYIYIHTYLKLLDPVSK